MASRIFLSDRGAAIGYEKLTVSSTAKQLTATKYYVQSATELTKMAARAMLTVEGDKVRYTLEGTAPVAATTGHLLNVGDILWLDSYADVKNLKMIRETTDATVHVTYWQ